MCKWKKHGDTRIDPCMRKIINFINTQTDYTTLACCCGHKKYPMSIIVESKDCGALEIFSLAYIPRKKRFYKKDKQGVYFIPEVNQSKQGICECGHKQWDEHKCTFDPMVAQECNVKGCKCKKFTSPKH